jgi:hypothetical protein
MGLVDLWESMERKLKKISITVKDRSAVLIKNQAIFIPEAQRRRGFIGKLETLT